MNDIYMLWLSSLTQYLPSRKLNELLQIFGTARAVFNAEPKLLQPHLSPAGLRHICAQRDLRYIESLLHTMERLGIVYFSRHHERFPELLNEIPDPPLGIFILGELPPENLHKVAIIGSRRCSEYGLTAARLLAKPLAHSGIIVVSGMARGVDSMAHKGALDGGGKTIAVLGCGVDICYPSENEKLRIDIINNGCLLSEYPPGTKPLPMHFPARNRIISGLCQGVVVTEAGRKSGTLITVDQASEQGREVLAVPGNIVSKLSEGTNQLIRDGATPVSSYEDILYALRIPIKNLHDTKNTDSQNQQSIPNKNLTPDEQQVYNHLTLEAITFDMLLDIIDIPPQQLHMICTTLELKGLIKRLAGARFIRSI